MEHEAKHSGTEMLGVIFSDQMGCIVDAETAGARK